MPAAARYRVADDVIDRAIGSELLVHRFDTDQVFILNEDARRVFEAVRADGRPAAVRARIAAQVFGDRLEIHQAVDGALDDLQQKGLIQMVARTAARGH